jgi:hypothetical protein
MRTFQVLSPDVIDTGNLPDDGAGNLAGLID